MNDTDHGDPPSRSRRRTWLRRIGLSIGALFVLGVAGAAVAWASIPVPDVANELADAQTTIVYYDDGTTEMARIAEQNRESVPLARVPEHVRKAVIAAEDRDFYSNSGISPTGILRSVWQAVRGSEVQGGGSTITQQYVKNYFLTQERTLSRKLQEMVISVKIDKDQSKDQILEGYLNTIYYGRGAYGIQAAARAYFGKDVGQLTVAEGAVLASVINAPSLYDPALGPKQAGNLAGRVGYVLDGMVAQGWLGAAERTATTMPTVAAKAPSRILSGPNGYVVAAVRQELKSRLRLTDQDIDRGGLRITTTISKSAQDAAIAAMDKDFPATGVDDVYAGLVAVKPGDGAVVAMYGGRDYQARQFSSATDAKIPAGSTFKPFALVGALQQKVSTKTVVDGTSPLRDPRLGSAAIENEGKRSYGQVDLRRATASSINTAFMRLNLQIGAKATYDAAVAAGIPADTVGLGQEYTNVLGTAAPRVLDLADAYATIAAQGRRATPYLIAKAGATALDLGYTVTPNVQDAFGKDVAADVVDAMRQVTAAGGTGARAAQVGRPVAGKTGTSEERKSVWFAGFTPQLSTAVAMYKDVDGAPAPLTDIGGLDELSGNSFPLTIWIDFMKGALSGQPVVAFPERVGIGDDAVAATRQTPAAPTTSASPTPTVTVTAPPAPAPPASPPPSTPPTSTPAPSATPARPTGSPSR